MGRLYSLAHLTVLGCPPPEMVYLAARCGYDYVSLRLIPMGIPGEHAYLPQDREMMQKTKTALQETGVRLLDIELARIVADRDPAQYEPAMAAAAELGGKHVIASAWTTDRQDRAFLIERYGAICDLAARYQLTVELEFPSFSRLTNLQEAVDIVQTAGRPNSGILVDTLYYHFSRTGLDELAALPANWLHFMHLCDTEADIPRDREGLIHIARDARLYVGEGSINFAAILAKMPANLPLSIELPNAQRVSELGYEGHARRCLESAKQYLADC